jgi:uncharacterized protein (UPF0335 family)
LLHSRKEIEKVIVKGYLQQFIKKKSQLEEEEKKTSVPLKRFPKIKVILENFFV